MGYFSCTKTSRSGHKRARLWGGGGEREREIEGER